MSNRAYVSKNPAAFYHIAASDFGAPAPAAASLVYQSLTGTIGTGTTSIRVTWITQEGVSLPSVVASIATPHSGEVLVSQPPLPVQTPPAAFPSGGYIIGWQIYSAFSTSLPAVSTILMNGGTQTNPIPINVVYAPSQQTALGLGVPGIKSIQGFLLSTTQVAVKVAGTGAVVPIFDTSGVQTALPSVPANGGADYYAVVPNGGSQWKQQKCVQYMTPEGLPETAGIVMNALSYIQPVYPGAAQAPQGGANPPSGTYTQASVAPGTYMTLNNYLFEAMNLVSASTAAAFIGWSAFNLNEGSQTTDGSVIWQSYGKAGLVRFQFGNVTAGALQPVSREYDLWQE